MQYVIKIKGLIGYDEKEECFTYSDLLAHLEKAKSFDSLLLDIDSQGGYINVMEKMIEALQNSGKTIYTMNSGLVASCASVLFLLADADKRTYYPKKGEFLIHLPFANIEGTSDDLLRESNELKELEKKFINFYAEKTGASHETIMEIMKQDEPISSETIQNLGFANVFIENKKMLFAGKNQKIIINQKKMENVVLEKLNEIVLMLKKAISPKMVMINDQSGNELEFPELKSESELIVGSMVNVAGAPANGEFILSDGKKIIAVNGYVTEIIEVSNESELLKAQIEELQGKLDSVNAEKNEMSEKLAETSSELEETKSQLMKINTEFQEVKKMSSKFMVAPAAPKSGEEEKSFSYKKK